ncbi:MAG: diguanylate cyclase, partial [Pseudomonadota bacterium]
MSETKQLHPALPQLAQDAREGKMDRREFLATASILGATTAVAYGMLGMAAPTSAHADGHAKTGGTLRIQQEVRAGKDPRTY